MGQQPIELILLRRLAARLALPVFLVDNEGTLVYRNEPADQLLGVLAGEMPAELPLGEMVERFRPADDAGRAMPSGGIPVALALRERRPQQASLWVHDRDGTPRHVTTTAIPLEGQGGTPIGAMSIFWETEPEA